MNIGEIDCLGLKLSQGRAQLMTLRALGTRLWFAAPSLLSYLSGKNQLRDKTLSPDSGVPETSHILNI